MNIGRATLVVAATAMAVSGCGYRIGGYQAASAPAAEAAPATAVVSVRSAPAVLPSNHQHEAHPTPLAIPPNAQGDPACPSSQAWGRHPDGRGVLVTFWADEFTAVTVLVRAETGIDVTERAVLDRGEIHLFDFPNTDPAAVREVLIMTNSQRCFAVADPATFK
ncbi:hypothetical protein E4P42_08475 [Mycobacterium sp. PS03-16]|uniref:hypothetical protein n=1 Tax=Mycobacterium sp. PS03-16 TaxID=2559611 RepID=UPI001073A15C|nr:hypothetical protein [Mycobacterium sp. PS03-16]TFV59434.1 hypothetical protein E4P42_08475 [Mycobacterium sp. PS03-16]